MRNRQLLLALASSAILLGSPVGVQAKPQPHQAKENKADLSANVASSREAIQSLERAKKLLQGQRGNNAHRDRAVILIQQAMGEVRSQTSRPGH